MKNVIFGLLSLSISFSAFADSPVARCAPGNVKKTVTEHKIRRTGLSVVVTAGDYIVMPAFFGYKDPAENLRVAYDKTALKLLSCLHEKTEDAEQPYYSTTCYFQALTNETPGASASTTVIMKDKSRRGDNAIVHQSAIEVVSPIAQPTPGPRTRCGG